MTWQLAPALEVLRKEVNRLAPDRNKASDGTIGDAAHAARKSDHNPNKAGIVCAIDLTNDPDSGFDAHKFAEFLRLRCRAGLERRVSYIISNKRIASPREGWAWRDYTAQPNPHIKHVHISIGQASNYWRNSAKWFVAEAFEREHNKAAHPAVILEPSDEPGTPDEPKPSEKIHTVETGDTLFDIAKKYGVTLAALRKENKIEGSLIHPGDTIKIPAKAKK